MRTKNGILRQSVLLLCALFFCLPRVASAQVTMSCSTTTGPTQAGVAYSATCTASGGIAPYTWSISSGTLPDGLTLTPSTDTTSATISGTPTTAGSYNYTVEVTDSTPGVPLTAQQDYTGTIAPNITSISPTGTTAGQPGLTLTVNGAGFGSDSVVDFNSTALTTTVVSSNQVTAAVPANLITLAGTYQITLTSAGATSNAVPFTVAPTVSSLSPAGAAAGAPAFTLTVNGTGFEAGATVNFNGTSLSATVLSPIQLTASVPANLIAAPGTIPVSVVSAGLLSNSVNFTVVPAPAITSISPSTAAAGGPAFTLTVNGSNFGSDSVVYFNGTALSTTVVNASQVTASVPANLIAAAGTFPVTLTTGGATSNAVNFTVVPAPAISSINPTSTAAGGSGFTLTVNGANFGSDSVVNFNGTAVPTTVVNSTQVTAAVPANLITTSGTVPVTLTTGGVTSSSVNFAVLPNVSSISPSSATAGGPGFTLTVNGSGFTSGAVVQWNGSALATSYVNSSQLTAPVLASVIASPGTAQVTVLSSGLTSNAVTFTVLPAPATTSISPATVTAGGPAFTLTVNGSGFGSSAVVDWNGSALATSVLSSNEVTASVPANLIASVGSAQITVTSGGATSNAQTLTIVAGPALSGISPNTITAGSSGFTLIANGTGFASGAVVEWNGSPLATNFNSANQLTAAVPASLVASVGTAQISVLSGGVTSNQLTFTIVAAPTISSISPNTITAGSSAFTLTVIGSGFASGAVVEWNGSPLATSFINPSELTAPVLANLILTPGTAQITVSSGGVNSNSVSFTIVMGPAVTSLSPNTTSAGGAAFTLTVNGTGFASGAVVQWNGTALATTMVSATQLTASVPANLIASPSAVSVTVLSGGVTSNSMNFAVVSGPTLSSLSPSSVAAGSSAFTLTVNGTGFSSGATVQWNGSALSTTFISANQLTAAVPSSFVQAYGTAQITVVSGTATSNALQISLVVPAITLTGLASTSVPTQQLHVGIQLANATPVALTGTLQLSFSTTAPGVPAGYVDPGLQFSAGGTTLSFTIPAGSASVSPLPGGTIQQGTVEGTITVTLTSLTSAGTSVLPAAPVTGTVIIPPLPPVITAGSAQITNLTSSGFDVVLTGYSTTRDMMTANFSFTAAAGTSFTGPTTFSVPVGPVFSAWFSSPAGQANGSMFLLTVPFTITGDTGVLQSVTVTLTNSVGTSVSATASP